MKPIGILSAPQLTHASSEDSRRQNTSHPGMLSTFWEQPSTYTIQFIARIVISTSTKFHIQDATERNVKSSNIYCCALRFTIVMTSRSMECIFAFFYDFFSAGIAKTLQLHSVIEWHCGLTCYSPLIFDQPKKYIKCK